MKFFNSLLEALHSATIDELTERYPEPKPELGLPHRSKGFDAPEGCSTSLIIRVTARGTSGPLNGWVLLSCDPDVSRELALDELWPALLKRAASEFKRRCIEPKFAEPSEVRARIPDPSGAAQPSRVIWIPLRVAAGQVQLGVGI